MSSTTSFTLDFFRHETVSSTLSSRGPRRKTERSRCGRRPLTVNRAQFIDGMIRPERKHSKAERPKLKKLSIHCNFQLRYKISKIEKSMNRSRPFAALLFLFSLSITTFAQREPLPQKNVVPWNCDLLIVGGTVVTMDTDRRLIEDGAVAIKGGKIAMVGKRDVVTYRLTAKQTINAAGKVIIPGLVNTHTHVPMVLFRGIADDLDLQEWLTKYIFPAEAKNVTEDFVRVGTRLGLAEMIRSGTTTYCDMYYFEDAIADETFKAGMRGVLGETVI